MVDEESGATETVPAHVWEFANEQDQLKKAADQMRGFLYELSTEGLIPVHTIETRAKSLTSYMEKCSRIDDGTGAIRYQNPLSEIDDCVAARVIVYTTRARRDFLSLLTTRSKTRDHANPGKEKHNGYDSDHLVVTSIELPHLNARYPDLGAYLRKRPGLEVQIRTVAGHAWAEYEHDVRYKSAAYRNLEPGPRKRVDQWFIEAGGLRRYLDQVFNEIDEFLVPSTENTAKADEGVDDSASEAADGLADPDDRSLDLDTLTSLINDRYRGAAPGSEEAAQELLDQLDTLGIRTVAELQTVLDQNDPDEVASLMDYPIPVSATRRLDDELLAAFTRKYVDAAAPNEARQQLLRLRLRRVDGRFTIYVLEPKGKERTRPIAAARAVRELTRLVADELGPEQACIEHAIALERGDLQAHTNPRVVQVGDTAIYVATNLNRAYSEQLMRQLVDRLPRNEILVLRAGDQILPSLANQQAENDPQELSEMPIQT
ncbi:hypothetical protein R4P47_05010 [Rhodococcus sp. IEGM 1370]|uniref:hypothetical protein n=1 Tax=Rhodococcus sp. IEGM 1370 TaxID=3082222 RepID=UPI0029538B47|nr:hypothetical protein [Rhodococcus sp. IEGM 1370]MDV8075911.1 hypothetical protein [Rhodococcus sp. IEGM 1370]